MSKTTRRAGAAIIAIAASVGFILVTSSTAGAVRPLAKATIKNAANVVIGTVVFSGSGSNAEQAEVHLTLPADAPGLGGYHGFHVHTVGSCGPTFAAASGHWNPTAASHGSHTGDLPSILVAADGTASATFAIPRFNVADLFDADGSAVILHTGADNFGNVPIETGKYEDPNSWYTSATGTGRRPVTPGLDTAAGSSRPRTRHALSMQQRPVVPLLHRRVLTHFAG